MTNHGNLRRRGSMHNEPIEDWIESPETEFLGGDAKRREIRIECKILNNESGSFNPSHEITDRQSVQTRLGLVPDAQHSSANSCKLPRNIESLPQPFNVQALKFRCE